MWLNSAALVNAGNFTETTPATMYSRIDFDANKDEGGFGNNMAGHATGPDIHPNSIYLVPLISY